MSEVIENPSLESFVELILESRLANLHVSLPAKIVSYDATKQCAAVQPLIKRKFSTGQLIDLPVINNVPVIHPRAGSSIIHLPIEKDDIVQLVFSERSIDRWKSQGGAVDPADTRKHSLPDAIAIPGGYPFNDVVTIQNTTDFLIDPGEKNLLLGAHAQSTHAAGRADMIENRLVTLETGLNTLISSLQTFFTSYNLHTHVATSLGAPTAPPVPPGVPPVTFTPDASVIASQKVKVD